MIKNQNKIYNKRIAIVVNKIIGILAEIEGEKEALMFDLEKIEGSTPVHVMTSKSLDKYAKIFTKTNGTKCFYSELNYHESNDL